MRLSKTGTALLADRDKELDSSDDEPARRAIDARPGQRTAPRQKTFADPLNRTDGGRD
jgi:hypothetical protein